MIRCAGLPEFGRPAIRIVKDEQYFKDKKQRFYKNYNYIRRSHIADYTDYYVIGLQ